MASERRVNIGIFALSDDPCNRIVEAINDAASTPGTWMQILRRMVGFQRFSIINRPTDLSVCDLVIDERMTILLDIEEGLPMLSGRGMLIMLNPSQNDQLITITGRAMMKRYVARTEVANSDAFVHVNVPTVPEPTVSDVPEPTVSAVPTVDIHAQQLAEMHERARDVIERLSAIGVAIVADVGAQGAIIRAKGKCTVGVFFECMISIGLSARNIIARDGFITAFHVRIEPTVHW